LDTDENDDLSAVKIITMKNSIAKNNALPLAGGTMIGDINMNSNKIINLPTPVVNTDAATKQYVDDNFMNKNGGVFFGPILV